MDFQQILTNIGDPLFRWIHVVAGIMWIGLLYFFNFVNGPFQGKMDGETKKKVNPELMPRALYWFRWGAAFTWITGVILLLIIFYMSEQILPALKSWKALYWVALGSVLVAPIIYDLLAKSVIKTNKHWFIAGVILSSGFVLGLEYGLDCSFRGYAIHLGAMLGTIMAFNVWFRIWPAQRKIITAIKDGQPPDAALVGLAGARSKHNTYMSVPLVLMMVSAHATWMSEKPYMIPCLILAAWLTTFWLYKKAATVKGF